jgi:hypothetical protein
MNPNENSDYQRRLDELESQLDKEHPWQSVDIQPQQPLERQVNPSQGHKSIVIQAADWFNRLPSAGKVAVVSIAVLVGFSILRSLLQLVASLFSLAILGVILYLVYKFFVAPQSAK